MATVISRRSALLGLGSLGTAALAGARMAAAAPRGFFARTKLPLGVQLYTLASELRADFQGTLEHVAKIGYKRVELAGFLGRSAAELRTAFGKVGLECHSAHIPVQSFQPDGGDTLQDMPKLIDDAKTLGLRYIVLPIFPIPANAGKPGAGEDPRAFFRRALQQASPDDYSACADLLNEKGALLAKCGLKMGYHNHNVEMAAQGDVTGLDILMQRTDPELVRFEMDAGWVAAAGLDPTDILKRYPGRFRMMHVKDIKASTKPNFAMKQDPADMGSGMVQWPRILPAAYEAGIRDFFVEHEPPYVTSPLASLEKSFHYLNSLRA